MNLDLNKFRAKPNESIREHTDKLIVQANLLNDLGYIKSLILFSDLLVGSEYHDYGKANTAFLKRLNTHKHFNSNKEVPHSVLSVFFVDKDKCSDYISVCYAVLYHHYHKKSPMAYLRENEELIMNFLEEMGGNHIPFEEIYDCIDEIGDIFLLPFDNSKKQYAVLLKGFLHKCDYSASAGIDCEKENDFLIDVIENWKIVNRFRFNPLQEFCLKNSENDIIATAPTGMGKTEAGLLWCGNNKCFFVLPLKTAINAMYDRLKKLCGSEFKDRVALIHSDMKSQYFQEGAVNESGEIDFDYCVRSRQLSLPISVCTPDQIFDFVLKYPGYEYKLATASYSKFIVDEIQMYSPDLLAAIIYAIELIHKLGGKIAVVTATLPPFVKNELERVLGENVAEKDFSALGISRHNVNVIEDKMDSSYILNKIRQIESDTVKKFLIVCNSIDTADKIYSCLSEELEDIEVNLFHAAFTKNDRAKKESAICNVSQDRSKTEVWISTSVVEASLDIDFDILFTELSDLFSLFQRFGRVNRQGLKDFTDYNCFVFTEMQGNAKKYHFTDDTIHSLSKQAIMSVDGIISEETKSRLIKKYLSAEKIKNSDYYKSYCDALEYYRTTPDYLNGKNDRLRNIDREDVIPISVYCANQEEILKAQDVIRSSHSDSQDKLKASEIIMGFTVSTAKYNIDKYKTKDFVDLRYNIIPVINCEYNDKRGMTIVNKDEPNITNEVDNII